jgi:hypothetical protein
MADTWDSIQHWELVLPPSRPSAAQLTQISSLIQGVNRDEPVAILGSTPEFRDLLYECGFTKIYVLDRNTFFYNSMSQGRIYKNQEQFVKGDWIDILDQFRNTFSIVLSDLTSGNIPYEQRGIFYKLIAGSLKEGGFFCDKVLTHPGPLISVHELIGKYSQLPRNILYINYFSCEMFFCSELLDINYMVDSTNFYDILADRIQHPRVREFVNDARKITPPKCHWWYGRKWDELKGEYCSDLQLIKTIEEDPSSPYFGRAKQFIHIRRAK